MPQIFHRSFNVISKASIFGFVLVVIVVAWVLGEFYRSSYVTRVDVAVQQPVPFSHEHHVGKLGIDCRYCHTSVEESPFAGMPSTKTCMNCHSQIWVGSEMLAPVRESYRTGRPLHWNRVHNLAGFVQFNHAVHVQAGVGCASCHGRVDRMPLMWKAASLHMEWCLDCHRNPAPHLRPREEVFNMAWEMPRQTEALEGLAQRLNLDVPPDETALRRALAEHYGVRQKTDCSICHY